MSKKPVKKKKRKYVSPILICEGNYSDVFSGIRVGPNCSTTCSRHVPD